MDLVNEGGVASKTLDFLVRNDESTNSLGKIDEEWWVSNIVLCDQRGVVSDLLEVLLASRTKDWKTEDGETDEDGAVLDQEVIETAHEKLLVDDEVRMLDQLVERIVDSLSFPVVASVEGNFFGMMQEVSVASSIVTFQF